MAVPVCARALHWTTKVALVVHIDNLEFHRPRIDVRRSESVQNLGYVVVILLVK